MGAELDMNTFSPRLACLFVGATLLALPSALSGCGQTACFVWTEQEGVCPGASEALQFFNQEGCAGHVSSVEGPGSFDGQLCCYPVSYRDTYQVCSEPGVGGDIGVSPGNPVGGVGGVGGTPPCTICEEGLVDPGTATQILCPDSFDAFDALFVCGCSGPCASACEGAWCFLEGPASDACVECMKLAAPDGCAAELDVCLTDT
jgi:hypothetical protein